MLLRKIVVGRAWPWWLEGVGSQEGIWTHIYIYTTSIVVIVGSVGFICLIYSYFYFFWSSRFSVVSSHFFIVYTEKMITLLCAHTLPDGK